MRKMRENMYCAKISTFTVSYQLSFVWTVLFVTSHTANDSYRVVTSLVKIIRGEFWKHPYHETKFSFITKDRQVNFKWT